VTDASNRLVDARWVGGVKGRRDSLCASRRDTARIVTAQIKGHRACHENIHWVFGLLSVSFNYSEIEIKSHCAVYLVFQFRFLCESFLNRYIRRNLYAVTIPASASLLRPPQLRPSYTLSGWTAPPSILDSSTATFAARSTFACTKNLLDVTLRPSVSSLILFRIYGVF